MDTGERKERNETQDMRIFRKIDLWVRIGSAILAVAAIAAAIWTRSFR
ncbi:hypothetical protein ACFPVX_06060 [Cohnella faecalis]|nr:hypothetical protein [Cohnella faecalis]